MERGQVNRAGALRPLIPDQAVSDASLLLHVVERCHGETAHGDETDAVGLFLPSDVPVARSNTQL